jgi:hypothetical protein
MLHCLTSPALLTIGPGAGHALLTKTISFPVQETSKALGRSMETKGRTLLSDFILLIFRLLLQLSYVALKSLR